VAESMGMSSYDNNSLRQINMGDGVVATDGATLGQLQSAQSAAQAYTDTAVAGLTAGVIEKGAVRVAVGTNVALAAPGATVDGVAMVVGDVFLAYGQTTGSENGPWVWTGAATAATRAANWNTQDEARLGSKWTVLEGSKADMIALLTNDVFTLGTTTAAFTFFPLAPTAMVTHEAQCPAVAAGATWTVTHNFGTRKLIIDVWWATGTMSKVPIVTIERPTVNIVEIKPDVALAAGAAEAYLVKVG
jgi:hypothetical protein